MTDIQRHAGGISISESREDEHADLYRTPPLLRRPAQGRKSEKAFPHPAGRISTPGGGDQSRGWDFLRCTPRRDTRVGGRKRLWKIHRRADHPAVIPADGRVGLAGRRRPLQDPRESPPPEAPEDADDLPGSVCLA